MRAVVNISLGHLGDNIKTLPLTLKMFIFLSTVVHNLSKNLTQSSNSIISKLGMLYIIVIRTSAMGYQELLKIMASYVTLNILINLSKPHFLGSQINEDGQLLTS